VRNPSTIDQRKSAPFIQVTHDARLNPSPIVAKRQNLLEIQLQSKSNQIKKTTAAWSIGLLAVSTPRPPWQLVRARKTADEIRRHIDGRVA
jgi:hypothetical protein